MKYLGYAIEGGDNWSVPHIITDPQRKKLGIAYSIPGAKRMVHVALGLDKCDCGHKLVAHGDGSYGRCHHRERIGTDWGPVCKCPLTRGRLSSQLKRKRDEYARRHP